MLRTIEATYLAYEAHALLTRLERVKPFGLTMPMVDAARTSPSCFSAIERYLAQNRIKLKTQVKSFLTWLHSPQGIQTSAVKRQRLFVALKMKFNNALDQLDIFADALTQRGEHEMGVWLGGLDALAADALTLRGHYYKVPPVICYVDRGHGAAIRRQRTRMPGGSLSPVAVIRVPRERLVGSGIASSLVHECGHQASVLLDLVKSMRPNIRLMQSRGGTEAVAWTLWERWLSEVLADAFSVARVGVASTLGLIHVVSLPRWFVFRIAPYDPHPVSYIRVKVSAAVGQVFFPDQQWSRIVELWESMYPKKGLDDARSKILASLERTLPRLVELIANHRPPSLHGKSLKEALDLEERQPVRLRTLYRAKRFSEEDMLAVSPTMAFAILGQAKADGYLKPQQEGQQIDSLLRIWALRGAGPLMLRQPICKPPQEILTYKTEAVRTGFF